VFTYLSGEQMIPDTLKKLRSLGAPMANLALNDKETFVARYTTVMLLVPGISVVISTCAGPVRLMLSRNTLSKVLLRFIFRKARILTYTGHTMRRKYMTLPSSGNVMEIVRRPSLGCGMQE